MSKHEYTSNEIVREERKEARRQKKDNELDDICFQILDILRKAEPDSLVHYDVDYFAEKLNYSKPHMQRFCSKLVNMDLIEYKRGIKSYVIKEKAEQIYSKDTKEKLAVIASLKGVLQQYRNTPMYENVEKLIYFLEPKAAKESNMFSRITVPPQMEFSVDQRNWDKVKLAMEQNRKISFRYEGYNSNPDQKRTVHPYQILLDEGSVYLFGHSEHKDVDVVYILNRMKDLTVMQETFELPEDFDFSSRTNGGLLGAFKGSKAEKVKIEFYGYAAEWIKEHRWAKDQVCEDTEDSTIVTFTTNQTWKVFTKMMSWGGQAKPLAPKKLVDWWKSTISDMNYLLEKE